MILGRQHQIPLCIPGGFGSCVFPVMIASLPTCTDGRDGPTSVMASADAMHTLSNGASVASGVPSVGGPVATFVAGGWCFLSTRLACTLSAICRSNAQTCAGFGGQVGTPAQGRGAIRWQTGEWHGWIK